jgi:hypothetical protein
LEATYEEEMDIWNAVGLRAQTTSELLQKGIYMQETVGDLDGAFKLYRQDVDMNRDSRALVTK